MCECGPDDYEGSDFQKYGAALGNRAGTWLGRKIGTWTGAAFASVFGNGDYTVSTNSIVKGGGFTESTQIIPKGDGSVVIRFKEYLGDVFTHPTTAGAFYTTSYPINPGLLRTFPWLSPIAQQFDQWVPLGVVFEYKSTSSEYVSTQALGSVIMATEYDALDTIFQNKQEMLNCVFSQEGKPSLRAIHGVECAPNKNPKSMYYVRSGAVGANDIREYDLGTFVIATQGGATANLNLGSLYVHYDIVLLKNQLFNGIPSKGPLNGYYSLVGVDATNKFGLTSSVTGGNLGTDLTIAANLITFPTWTVGVSWLITFYTAGAGAAALTLPTNTWTGLDVEYGVNAPSQGTSTSIVTIQYVVKQTARVATWAVSGTPVWPTGTLTTTLRISEISDSWDVSYS